MNGTKIVKEEVNLSLFADENDAVHKALHSQKAPWTVSVERKTQNQHTKLELVAFLYANSGNTEKEIKKTNALKKIT